MTRQERCKAVLDRLTAYDPDTADVVAAMRLRGRSWGKIYHCFLSHMKRLGMDVDIEETQ